MRGSRSVSDSGCHCTPRRNRLAGDSRPSTRPSGATRGGHQAGREVLDALVVHAVHLQRRGAHQRVEAGAGGDGDPMGQVVPGEAGGGEVVVLDRIGALRRDVLVERATERHVHDLETRGRGRRAASPPRSPSGRT